MSPDLLLQYVVMPILFISIALSVGRLVRGPRLADRVISLDIFGSIGVGIIAVYATINDAPVFVDAASILALISFLGTIAFAYYLQRRNQS